MQFPSTPSMPSAEQPKRRGRPPSDGVVFVKKDLLLANQNCRSKEEDVVSVSQLKKMRDIPKKPMSEAQKAHIKNLLEGNAKRHSLGFRGFVACTCRTEACEAYQGEEA